MRRLLAFLSLVSIVLSCLMTSVSVYAEAQDIPLFSETTDASNFAETLEIAYGIQSNKELYKYLNLQLASLLVISEENQLKFKWPAKAKGLSESQIVTILQSSPRLMDLAKRYLFLQSSSQAGTAALDKLKSEFELLFRSNGSLLETLQKLADPTIALPIHSYKGKPAIRLVKTYVNHPILIMENGVSKEEPASNLKNVVKEFVRGAKSEVWGNFFDFDLMDVAEVFGKKAQENVLVNLGIDKNVVKTRPEVRGVVDYLRGLNSASMNVVEVDSVGLNHMKILVRDAGTPNAAILLLSGNLTQSCIGPEGDLVGIPAKLRPKESVPNANHAVLVKGEAPAIFARHQLKKVLIDGVRGQSKFPLGGAYKFYEAPNSSENAKVKEPWMILSFSPNGGMGDINNDILKQVILTTTGPIRFLQFAFSSPAITESLAQRVQEARAKGLTQGIADFGGLGDTIFAMRDFSVFLAMSGLKQDPETKMFSAGDNILTSMLSVEEKNKIADQVFIAPQIYGEKSHTINGQNYRTSAKIHHKVMIVPDFSLAVAGTSFNFSMNAESNNEQVAIFRNENVSQAMLGALDWLTKSSGITVQKWALRKNNIRERLSTPALNCSQVFL